jgi:hypothetical protein
MLDKLRPFREGKGSKYRFHFMLDVGHAQQVDGLIRTSFSMWSYRPVYYQNQFYVIIASHETKGWQYDDLFSAQLLRPESIVHRDPFPMTAIFYSLIGSDEKYLQFTKGPITDRALSSYFAIRMNLADRLIDVHYFDKATGKLLTGKKEEVLRMNEKEWEEVITINLKKRMRLWES